MSNNSQIRTWYYKVVRLLLENCDCEREIKVRRTCLPSTLDGECVYSRKKNKFFIHINKKLSVSSSIDTLIHEIGHALAWGKDKTEDHGRNWGIAYSKAYRVYEKKFLNESI